MHLLRDENGEENKIQFDRREDNNIDDARAVLSRTYCNAWCPSKYTVTSTATVVFMLLVWVLAPLVQVSIRKALATESEREFESEVLGEFDTFHDVGWKLMDWFKFHEMLASSVGAFVTAMTITACLTTFYTVLGAWMILDRKFFRVEARRHKIHHELLFAFVVVHAVSFVVNSMTMFPMQPGMIIDGHIALYYAVGITVPEAEPLFSARLCFVWLVHVHLFAALQRNTSSHRTAKLGIYGVLLISSVAYLCWYVMSTHTAYTFSLGMSLALAVFIYVYTHIFDRNIQMWNSDAAQKHRNVNVEQLDLVRKDEDTFEIGVDGSTVDSSINSDGEEMTMFNTLEQHDYDDNKSTSPAPDIEPPILGSDDDEYDHTLP